MDVFKGEQHHSSQHPGPDAYKGKKAVVIGSNNSAHDICAALWEAGADVTMVQRSSTHIVRSDTLMEIGLGALYSEQAVASGMTTEKADLIFASLPYRIMHEFQIPLYDEMRERDADFYDAAGGGRLPARLRRRRLRPVHEVPAPRLGLLHRRRRLRPRRRRQDQAAERHRRPPDRGRGRDGRRHRAAGRPRRLRHRLRLDERLGRRPDLPGGRRQGRQGLGARLRHDQGPGPVGGRAAQHVEADAAGGAVVPRRQPAPVAPLLALPRAAAQGARPRASTRPVYGLQEVHHLS